MKANIEITAIWLNTQIAKYFFRPQAYATFEELVRTVGGNSDPERFSDLENKIEDTYDNLDCFEEDCYSASVDDLMEMLGY